MMDIRKVWRSEEWDKLTPMEKLLYLEVKSRYDGRNNGKIYVPITKLEQKYSRKVVSKIYGAGDKKGTLEQKEWVETHLNGGYYRYKRYFKLTWKYDIHRK